MTVSGSGAPSRKTKRGKASAGSMKRKFTVIIEKDPEGGYVAAVAELPGCHTQAGTLRKLRANVKEAIELYLEASEPIALPTFVKVEHVEV